MIWEERAVYTLGKDQSHILYYSLPFSHTRRIKFLYFSLPISLTVSSSTPHALSYHPNNHNSLLFSFSYSLLFSFHWSLVDYYYRLFLRRSNRLDVYYCLRCLSNLKFARCTRLSLTHRSVRVATWSEYKLLQVFTPFPPPVLMTTLFRSSNSRGYDGISDFMSSSRFLFVARFIRGGSVSFFIFAVTNDAETTRV